jgi:hypothetical protein
MSYDEERARGAALRADQEVIDRAAVRLRHETAQDQYRGLRDPQVAFGLCALLDELSRHLRDLDCDVGRQLVELCWQLQEPTTGSTRRPRPGGPGAVRCD